jgi:hypothetical protein
MSIKDLKRIIDWGNILDIAVDDLPVDFENSSHFKITII